MDLELSDEQVWLSEAVETLLERNWPAAVEVAGADAAARRGLWDSLAEFGALEVGTEDGLGAIELCLVARELGARLAAVPYISTVAARFAGLPLDGTQSAAVALLEPGSGWDPASLRTSLESAALRGEKAGVEHAGEVDRLAVVARAGGETAVALVGRDARGIEIVAQHSLDPTAPVSTVTLDDVAVDAHVGGEAVERLITIGGLLAAAEAVGAAGAILEEARAYAAERRQFGRTIGSFQSLRHILADMYVRRASSWSTVLYAAASLDDEADDAARTASIAKAYVARSAREVAHGAMQVFGGIAFTEEHPAHRYLRRIVVREQQFGDAAHHERLLGRSLAERLLLPS